MAVVHVGNGSKSSGTSTANDWSESNVYPIASWATAVGAASDGDTIIFDNGQFTANALSLNAAPTGGHLNITSRSGNTVLLTADGATSLFSHGSVNAHTFTISNLIFDASTAAWTATGAPLIAITQNCASIEFSGCTWRNVTTSTAARTVPLLVRYLPSLSGAAGAMTLTDCAIRSVSATCSGDFTGLFVIQDNGANSVDNVLNVSGLVIDGVDTETTSTGDNLGLIQHTNSSSPSWERVKVTNCTFSGPSGQSVAGLYRGSNSPGVLTIFDLIVDTVTMNGAASTEALIKAVGTASISKVVAYELRRTGAESAAGNSLGGIVVSTGEAANVTISDMVITSSGGFYGTAFYSSNGGHLTARRVYASDIDDNAQVSTAGDPINGLAFYSGGDGDALWESCVANNCQGSATNGLAWYVHLAATGDESKTFTARNCTFSNSPVTASQPAGAVKQFLALNTLTATFENCVFSNGPFEIDVDENAGTLNLVIDHCAIASSEVTHNISTGAYTFTNNRADQPALDPTGKPLGFSFLMGQGKLLAAPKSGVDSNGFSYPPPIGAYDRLRDM